MNFYQVCFLDGKSHFSHQVQSYILPAYLVTLWTFFSKDPPICHPIHMKGLPKSKLGRIEIGSNIAQNHSSSHEEVIAGHYLPQFNEKLTKGNIAQNHSSSHEEVISGHYLPEFTLKVDQKCNYVKLESVRTLLRITRLDHRKSYLVIICPNSHNKLTKSEIM